MPWVGFEPTIPAFKRAKTVHALDRAATVIGRKSAWIAENKFHINLFSSRGWIITFRLRPFYCRDSMYGIHCIGDCLDLNVVRREKACPSLESDTWTLWLKLNYVTTLEFQIFVDSAIIKRTQHVTIRPDFTTGASDSPASAREKKSHAVLEIQLTSSPVFVPYGSVEWCRVGN
jgi:hypothetical protein